MYGRLVRYIRSCIERFKASLRSAHRPVEISTNEKVVELCQNMVESVQGKLHLKYSPLEARLVFVKTTHSDILELIKFLKRINKELGAPKPQLLASEFPFNQVEIQLDSFFISSSGNYIPQSTIAELVVETQTTLGFARVLAKAEAGIEEYHFRMLLRTLSNLTSIHSAISTVLAE